MQDKIIIKGAREHNLKNINLELPRHKMIVFTGVSGSGKSSLAFDTIFAEGQRRYVESLSAYARQFLGEMQRPDVDDITGLSPAISIDQKSRGSNPRSTVATITEIYDYLRVLFARIGEPYCPTCNIPIEKMTSEEIVDVLITEATRVYGAADRKKIETNILAPVVVGRKGEYHQMLYDFYNSGFMYVRVDGKRMTLSRQVLLNPKKKHTIELVTDMFAEFDFRAESPSSQSSPGPTPARPVRDPSRGEEGIGKDQRARIAESIETALDYGNGVITIQFADKSERTLSAKFSCPNCNFSFPEIEPRLFSFNSPYGACTECHGLGTESIFSDVPCKVCEGKRLRKEALSVFVGRKNIVDISGMDIGTAVDYFLSLDLPATKQEIAGPACKEILNRLQFMANVGLDYLTLDRRAGTLSGGESQRIRLASQVGLRLVGGLYVLDEPTIGLHQHDNERLVSTLLNLRDIGNTVIVVEHDLDTIMAADYLVDFGPGAGKHGGEIVCAGPMPEILKDKKSLTMAYLRGDKKIPIPKVRAKHNRDVLKVIGAKQNNLKNVTVEIPLRRFVCITGVSGSGKSSLAHDVVYTYLAKKLNGAMEKPGEVKEIKGTEYLSHAVLIDQSPIGRTPRSNPATYTGIFTHIREIFAATPEARFRNYKIGRFSFNVPGGRCEHCEGHGYIAIEMHFLPTVYVTCEVCKGRRFDRETLEVHFKNKNIADVLKMTIEEAHIFFKDIPQIEDKLKVMERVGLGYMELGQSATTLSGGEAQRIKLSNELGKRAQERTFYLLDEPTTGLHFEDVRLLLDVLHELVDRGHTMVVIEHNLDVIKTADYIIDMGPEGGNRGGQVVATGTPEEIARTGGSLTGKYLKKYLK